MGFPFRIIALQEVPSTNEYAKDKLRDLENFSVIHAETQTSGYGRKKRTWYSSGDSLTFSIVFKDQLIQKMLVYILGVSVYRVLKEEYHIPVRLKWPNDIHTEKGKICGILVESIYMGSELIGMIGGIGLNISCFSVEEQMVNPLSFMGDYKQNLNGKNILHQILEKIQEEIILVPQYPLRYERFADFFGKWQIQNSSSGKKEWLPLGIEKDGSLRVMMNNQKSVVIFSPEELE